MTAAVEPSAEDLSADGAEFARGKDADHPFGVLYQGEWETPWDGTNTAVRLHARALAAQGLPVLLRSFSGTVVNADGVAESVYAAGVPRGVKREIGTLNETSIGTVVPIIKHAVVRDAEHLRNLVMPRHVVHPDANALIAMRNAVYGATILYSVWERDRIDESIAEQLSRCGQCWVPCEQNRETLVLSGVPEENVHVVPHPYDPDSDLGPLIERDARLRPERRFYSIGRWEPRKGYPELIAAFLSAFAPDDAATLTIKYSGGNWGDYVTPAEALKSLATKAHRWTVAQAERKIELIGERVARSQIVKLHYHNNIYVSSSHGEAFCLPAYEAKVAGNALVHVAYGGTRDFDDELTDLRVPFKLGPADERYGWEPGARWAHYSVDDLADALGRARAPERYTRPAGFAHRFSFDAVGRQMAQRVLALAGRINPKAGDYLRGVRDAG